MVGNMYTTDQLPPQLSNSNRQIFDTDSSSIRVYQVWKGSNKFFLGGRIVFGPDVRSLFISVSLIVTPVILFCAFVSQRIITEFPRHTGNLLVAICVIFTAYVIVLLFLTSGSDPGIVPRNDHPPEPEDEGDGSGLSADWLGSHRGTPSLPLVKDVMVNGMVVRVKYCQTCMLYRPPRCSHCSICNNCVERFDHHCPWVGQCIGKRNYRFFFMFVSSSTILCLYVFVLCWLNIGKIMKIYQCDLWKAFRISPVSAILIFYTFLVGWFVGGLTAFHIYLIMSNQTTYENFRYRYDGKKNPYNLGCVNNIRDILFSKIPRSKNKFRAKIKGDSSAVFTTMTPTHNMSPKKSYDIETGKRQAVAAEDFEALQRRIDSFGELERSGTQPSITNWDYKANWEMNHDIQMLYREFGLEHGLTDTDPFH